MKSIERLAVPKMIAGLLELAAHVRQDAQRTGAFIHALTEGSALQRTWRARSLPTDTAVWLDLPEFEEVRQILGLASPVMMDEAGLEQVLAALAGLEQAAVEFGEVIDRYDYAKRGTRVVNHKERQRA